MEAAGFTVNEAELCTRHPRFEHRERYETFLQTVILRQPMAELPESLRPEFLEQVSRMTLQEDGAYTFDYVRLNIRATA